MRDNPIKSALAIISDVARKYSDVEITPRHATVLPMFFFDLQNRIKSMGVNVVFYGPNDRQGRVLHACFRNNGKEHSVQVDLMRNQERIGRELLDYAEKLKSGFGMEYDFGPLGSHHEDIVHVGPNHPVESAEGHLGAKPLPLA
jgi:hypothetical protein